MIAKVLGLNQATVQRIIKRMRQHDSEHHLDLLTPWELDKKIKKVIKIRNWNDACSACCIGLFAHMNVYMKRRGGDSHPFTSHLHWFVQYGAAKGPHQQQK